MLCLILRWLKNTLRDNHQQLINEFLKTQEKVLENKTEATDQYHDLIKHHQALIEKHNETIEENDQYIERPTI